MSHRITRNHLLRVVLALFVVTIIDAAATNTGELDLIILHNNDMHARFEQTGKDSNTCQPADVMGNRCYGGFARVAYKLKEYREKAANGGTPVLYLNAGDTYAGTPWFTLYKDKIVTEFLNLLKPDAISLGNHEFDNNVDGLVPFLDAAHFPVLIANMDASREPTLAAAKSLRKSTVFTVKGVQIGVIGYLTPETKALAPANEVLLTDEVEAINAEAAILKSQGVDILIGLGHSGLQRDQEIGLLCPDLDLVIGGHSHSLLYTGAVPDNETEPVRGTYPVMVKRPDGSEVPVVQAYAFTKYLGYLELHFSADGKLTKFNGTPLLLDNHVPRDEDVLSVLEKYRADVESIRTDIVAETHVYLNGSCRFVECNLGNFIADSMVYQRAKLHTGAFWTDAAIALVQGGGVRQSVSVGKITAYDMLSVLPFANKLVVVELNAEDMWSTFERSVERYDGIQGYGEFLQMSGVRVAYNLSEPANHRVQSIQTLCADCDIPKYQALYRTDKRLVKVIISSFLNSGGDGFDTLRKPIVDTLPGNEKDATEDWLRQLKFVYPAVEGRVTLLGVPTIENETGGAMSSVRMPMAGIVSLVVLIVTVFRA